MLKKQRSSNIELLRIIAMLMIITFHIFKYSITAQLSEYQPILNDGDPLFNQPRFFYQLFLLCFISPLGKAGNAIFLTISGYFLVRNEKGINIKKTFIKIITQLGFCATLLTLLSFLTTFFNNGMYHLDLLNITIFNSMSWFVGYYFSVIVIAYVFLNKFLENLSKEKYTVFLMILFAVSELGWTSGLLDRLASGLRILLTGVFLYAFGGYIKLYDPFKKIKTYVFYLIILLSFAMVFVSYYNVTTTKIDIYNISGEIGNFLQSIPGYKDNSIIAIVIGLSLFEIFRRININYNKSINFIASSTLMIYLFHDNKFIHSIWSVKDWITDLYYRPNIFVLKLLLTAFVTFLVGFVVYLLYLLLLELFKKLKPLFMKKEL